ncbi:MAG: peptidase M20, partial [Anaerolineales bacterium]|nr:peptidase M20 [Anaerolineales bacterium]
MVDHKQADQYIESNLDASLAELATLCAVPSVAAQGIGIDEAVEVVQAMLAKRGFKTEVMQTGGAPVVYAERKGRNTAKTLLFYNHYDVQPAEPLELW